MRHQRSGKKLGRDPAHRKALYANLAGALIEHGRIRTTVTKAKAVKPLAEQMITLGRRGDLHARRQATAVLRSRDIVHLLFADVAPRFRDRPGGYTRIVRIGPRPGDAAEMAYLELVDEEYVAEQREARSTAAAAVESSEAAPTGTQPEDEELEGEEAAGEDEGEPEAESPGGPDEEAAGEDEGEPEAESPGGPDEEAADAQAEAEAEATDAPAPTSAATPADDDPPAADEAQPDPTA